ncbi:DUF2382 domain-containing protein [Streptomyces sp. NPDC007904]|uniref:PRC and DUF2382 domain-containing protein n=1 Tax=Streptomyces sp. NPDC007904 TaxID=3364787 RepID=UPI0036E5028F
MITREEIPTLLDHPVYDGDGNKIGEAKHVFLDDVSGRPEWVTVKTGLFGSSESFVPVRDASLVQDHLEVPYRKDKVKGAPNVDVDAGGHLSEDEEHRLYDYYGIDWDSVLAESGEAGDRDRTTGTGPAGAAGRATADTASHRGEESHVRAGTDDAMTRSEEQMHVGVERRESGRARLRKYVVTEEVQQTVPVRHEEVRVEREPITDANRDQAMAGQDITEAEHEVTLYEERPVVETEAVPVERVRLTTEERTEQETVRGQVRKEHIEDEAAGAGEHTSRRDRDVPERGGE